MAFKHLLPLKTVKDQSFFSTNNLQSNLAISNLVNLNLPTIRTQIYFPWTVMYFNYPKLPVFSNYFSLPLRV